MSFKNFYKMHILSGCVDFLISIILLFAGFVGLKFVNGFMEGWNRSKENQDVMEEDSEKE